MDLTTAILGFVSLGALAVITIVLAWPRRRVTTNRVLNRWSAPGRPGSRRQSNWFASDPLLFTGADPSAADCGAGGDGGGGGGGGGGCD